MKIGDLVRIRHVLTAHGFCEEKEESRIAMIIEGPNEVGKIKLLLSTGEIIWKHSAEVDYLPREREYLKA